MKIALVSAYDFAYPGGVGNHISALAYQFNKMGHEAHIIAPASGVVSTFGTRFIPIGRPWPFPGSGSIARVTISPWLSFKVRAVLDQEGYDIIHLHEPLCPMLCTTVLSFSHTANIGTFHAVDTRSYTWSKPLAGLFLKRLFSKLDGRIAVSNSAMEFTNKHFPADYTIIPNGVDLGHFSPNVLPIDEFNDGKINVLFVGRLEKRKGFNYLLEAYAEIKQETPNVRLIIVGPRTRWSSKYEKQMSRNGLADVVFTGRISYAKLPRYYKTADIVCSPATGRESFGLILLEAMAMGKPIVASNLPGYANVVTHGVEGLLAPPCDVGGLAQALTSLIIDRQLRQEMGVRGVMKASNYGWESIAKKVVEYYSKVLKKRSGEKPLS